MFIDTHSHLYSEEFKDDIEDVLKRAEAAGVKKIVFPDIDSEWRERMLTIADNNKGSIYPLVGLHPTSVNENYKEELAKVEALLEERKFWGIGETGIDLYWDKTFQKEQTNSFAQHAEWAIKYNLPLIIHARESLKEIFDVLDDFDGQGLSGIMHCFAGTEDDADKAIEKGFALGVGGVVTFKNSKLGDVIKKIKLENIVLETDSPYLAPVPFRGKRNESAYLIKVAEKLAEIYGVSLQDIERQTTTNAVKIFGF